MLKWAVVGLALVIIGLGVFTWRSLDEDAEIAAAAPARIGERTSSRPPSGAAARTPRLKKKPSAEPTTGRRGNPEPPPNHTAAARPHTELEREKQRVGEFLSSVVPRELYWNVSPCYRGGIDAGDYDKIVLSYRVVAEGSVARTSDPRIERSDFDDPAFEDCVLRAIRDHQFELDAPVTADSEGSVTFTHKGLTKLAKRKLAEERDD